MQLLAIWDLLCRSANYSLRKRWIIYRLLVRRQNGRATFSVEQSELSRAPPNRRGENSWPVVLFHFETVVFRLFASHLINAPQCAVGVHEIEADIGAD
jgi:hypothetical protein